MLRRVLILAATVAAALTVMEGCSVPEASVCSAGEVRACECGVGRSGTQSCGPEGAGYAACQCGGTGGTGGDDSGSGATGGTGGDDGGSGATGGTGGDDSGSGATGGTGGDDSGSGATGGTGGDDSGSGATGGTGGDDGGSGATGGTGGDDGGSGATGGTGGDDGGSGATGGTGGGDDGGTGGCAGAAPTDCSGACVDTSSDPLHCGGCGQVCSSAHVTSVTCSAGVCSGVCGTGWLDCDGDKLSNGCEVDGASDPQNCGGCGQACSGSHVGPVTCAGGSCNGTCSAGWLDCDGNKLSNGCEVDGASDPLNCGGCGKACSSAHISPVTCAAGSCNGPCASGWLDCDGNKLSNGCEVDGNVSRCPGPSCAAGLSCGGVSCCENRVVAGGTFPMGRSVSGTDASALGAADEQPEHPATVATFHLDTFEVTVARFRAFVQQYNGTPPALGAGAHPLIAGSGWQSAWNTNLPPSQAWLISNLKCSAPNQVWTDTPGANERYAMNCVTWYQAFAFCVWDGGRLPTEAEWEYAEAGGSENRLYPWGAQTPDATRANFNGTQASPFVNVGSYPAGVGRWGHHDLAGGMWEWTLDWYRSDFYQTIASCEDCANLVPATYRVRRGGGWVGDVGTLRAAYRYIGDPALAYSSYGFRCVRAP